MTELFVFALNVQSDLRHTNLTRARGEAAELPALAEWLGVEAVDPDQVELFPVKDLGEMSLPDYIDLAFGLDAPLSAEMRAKLKALGGSVLLVPTGAVQGDPAPGQPATLIAKLRCAKADHDAEPLKSDPTRHLSDETNAPAPDDKTPPVALYALLAIGAFAALIAVFGWGR